MGYKGIIQILLILAIISTICISIIKPKMHEPVMVLNSQFSVEHDDGIKIDEKNISVLVQDADVKQEGGVSVENQGGINFVEPKIEDVEPVKFVNNGTKTSNIAVQNTKTQNVSNSGVKNNSTNIKTTPVKTTANNITPAQTKVNTAPVTSNQTPKIDLNKIVSNNQKIINTPTQSVSTPVKTTNTTTTNTSVTTTKSQPAQTQAPVKTEQPAAKPQQTPNIRVSSGTTSTQAQPFTAKTETKPVVLTAQQEEIEWNKWRSNLNNQIMKDSKLPTMPNGVIFKYKFTVDKYGKITNVQTSSTTPGYTPYAIQFIAPVIRSYQGRAILNFPAGSNRVSTEVSGAWKISSNSKLSTPDDYHDVEKVKK